MDINNSGFKFYLSFTIPIIIFLCIIFFYNLFSNVNKRVIDSINYNKENKFPNIKSCNSIKYNEQYRICDYYIASSYLTPCLRYHNFDYISLDMIGRVIDSGARMIQIPITSEEPIKDSKAIVATVEPDTLITSSLNTLELIDVWKIIINHAFTNPINKDTLLQPLFVELILYQNTEFYLNSIADSIEIIFNNSYYNKLNLLANPIQYKYYPIFLEKICNLNNKIILLTNTDIKASEKLQKYVFQINMERNLYQKIEVNKLSSLFNPTEELLTYNYNQRLSNIEQLKNSEKFKNKYNPSLEQIILQNPINLTYEQNNILISKGKEILQDTDLFNKIIHFNKIGVTCIIPNTKDDNNNYNFMEPLTTGCQFIMMNYQNNDTYLKSYLNIFKENSFKLKPSSLRFTPTKKSFTDIQSLYPIDKGPSIPIINDFFIKYLNKLISLESYTQKNMVLTYINGNIYFTKKIEPPNINQYFLINKSKLSKNDISFNLLIPTNINLTITIDSNNKLITSILQKDKQKLQSQSFYPILSKTILDMTDINFENAISIQSFNKQAPQCLAINNKDAIMVNSNTNNTIILDKMTFFISTIQSTPIINFKTLDNDFIYVMNNGSVGLLNDINKNTRFIIEIIDDNQNIFNTNVLLKNVDTNLYLNYGINGILTCNEQNPNINNFFKLEKYDDKTLKILNNQNMYLKKISSNMIIFRTDIKINETNILFNYNLSYYLV